MSATLALLTGQQGSGFYAAVGCMRTLLSVRLVQRRPAHLGKGLRPFLQADVPTCLVDFLRGRVLRETELPSRVQCAVSPCEDPWHPPTK